MHDNRIVENLEVRFLSSTEYGDSVLKLSVRQRVSTRQASSLGPRRRQEGPLQREHQSRIDFLLAQWLVLLESGSQRRLSRHTHTQKYTPYTTHTPPTACRDTIRRQGAWLQYRTGHQLRPIHHDQHAESKLSYGLSLLASVPDADQTRFSSCWGRRGMG